VTGIQLRSAAVTEVSLAPGACHMITAMALLHLDLASRTRGGFSLQILSIGLVFLVLQHEPLNVILTVATFDEQALRRARFVGEIIYDERSRERNRTRCVRAVPIDRKRRMNSYTHSRNLGDSV